MIQINDYDLPITAAEMEKALRARIESLTFTLGLVIGMMAGLFVTMLMLVYIATK